MSQNVKMQVIYLSDDLSMIDKKIGSQSSFGINFLVFPLPPHLTCAPLLLLIEIYQVKAESSGCRPDHQLLSRRGLPELQADRP